MSGLAIVGIVVAGLAIFAVMSYNGLVSMRNQVQNALKQIDVQMQRRFDLIPNLVNSVKGYMKFESETLEKVIAARQQCIAVSAGDIKQMVEKEGALTQALTRFMAVSENYPDLKANADVQKLMEELSHTENQMSFARQFYNDLATRFNTNIETFPNVLFAASMGFTPAELFQLAPGAPERATPKVDLT